MCIWIKKVTHIIYKKQTSMNMSMYCMRCRRKIIYANLSTDIVFESQCIKCFCNRLVPDTFIHPYKIFFNQSYFIKGRMRIFSKCLKVIQFIGISRTLKWPPLKWSKQPLPFHVYKEILSWTHGV